jgi:hypothetical protein
LLKENGRPGNFLAIIQFIPIAKIKYEHATQSIAYCFA